MLTIRVAFDSDRTIESCRKQKKYVKEVVTGNPESLDEVSILLDVPTGCTVTARDLEEIQTTMLNSRNHETHFAVSPVIKSDHFSIYGIILVTTFFFDWVRGMFWDRWKNLHSTDLRASFVLSKGTKRWEPEPESGRIIPKIHGTSELEAPKGLDVLRYHRYFRWGLWVIPFGFFYFFYCLFFYGTIGSALVAWIYYGYRTYMFIPGFWLTVQTLLLFFTTRRRLKVRFHFLYCVLSPIGVIGFPMFLMLAKCC
jgi:hypothetical protein